MHWRHTLTDAKLFTMKGTIGSETFIVLAGKRIIGRWTVRGALLCRVLLWQCSSPQTQEIVTAEMEPVEDIVKVRCDRHSFVWLSGFLCVSVAIFACFSRLANDVDQSFVVGVFTQNRTLVTVCCG